MSRISLFASAAAAALFSLQATSAEAQNAFNWSGFYAGVHGGLLNGDVQIDDYGMPVGTGTIQGGVFGGLAGVNAATTPGLVWSLEADIGFGHIHSSGIGPHDAVPDYLYDFDWDLHFRVRAGVPIGNALPFIAAGLALAQLHVSESGEPTIGGLYTGGTIGGGVDWMLSPKMTGRVEVLRDLFQPVSYGDYTVHFSSWTARAALIFRLP